MQSLVLVLQFNNILFKKQVLLNSFKLHLNNKFDVVSDKY